MSFMISAAARAQLSEIRDIYNEVIDPLAQEGADLLCELNIVAQKRCLSRAESFRCRCTSRAPVFAVSALETN